MADIPEGWLKATAGPPVCLRGKTGLHSIVLPLKDKEPMLSWNPAADLPSEVDSEYFRQDWLHIPGEGWWYCPVPDRFQQHLREVRR